MKKNIILLFLLFLSAAHTLAQDWLPMLEQLADDDEQIAAYEQAFDLLCDLEQHPLDVNTATREQWQQLPFLASEDVEAICEYIDRHGPMKSLGELAMVGQLDYTKRQLLMYFVNIQSEQPTQRSFPSASNILKYGRHELMATARIPFYKRKGDDQGYLGYPYRHDLRYSFSYGQRFKVGLVGSQDAGEPFFANKNKMGYDFYSFYAVMNDIGRFKTIVLGRYRASFGMGLVVNNNLLLGKTWSINAMGAARSNIRQHSSRSAANYLQGVAATVSIDKQTDLSAFLSYRDIDATLNDDGSMATIVTSGYHRTQSEMDKKNNSKQLAAGVNVTHARTYYYIGATATYTRFDRDLHPNTKTLYRRYQAYGRDFWNAGIHYGLLLGPLTLHGETATGDSKAIATINRLSWQVNNSFSLMLLQRFYGMKYTTILGNSFSDGGAVQNESGLYAGASWRPSRRFNIEGFADVAYHPWAKYQTSRSSHAYDFYTKLTYALRRNWLFSAHYRMRSRQRDDESHTQLLWRTEHRARIAASYQTDALDLRTQLDLTQTTFEEKSRGWMLSQQASWNALPSTRLTGSIALFDTDDYDSRIYSYERSLRYDFSMPTYYGNGLRYMVMLRQQVGSRLTLNAKIGVTDYFDRSTIGTGYQLIQSSSICDLLLQIRWKI